MFGQYVALNGPGNAMAIVRAAGDWQVFDATFTQATAGRNNTNTNEDNGDGRNSGDDKDDKMEWEARPPPPTMLDTNDQRSLAAHSRRYLRQTDQDESDKDSTTTTTLTTQMIALSNDGRQVAVADSVFKSSTTAEASAVTPLPEIRMWKYGSSTISDNDGDVWERVGNVVTEFTLKHGTKVLALAVSADGQTLAVGGAGYIRVLRFIPGSNRWMPRGQILLASSFDWDEESLSLFGSKLAMSENGRILVTLTDSATLAMFEWKYESNFWNLQPIIPSSGSTEPITAFALSAVGTRVAYASGGTAVYVYDYVPLQSVWYQRGQAITHASDSSATFGSTIALSGDGSLLVVGTPDLGAGQVFFYGLVSNEWVQVYEVSLGITDGDRWGAFVTISRDGSTVAITADQQGQTVPNLGYVGILTIPSS